MGIAEDLREKALELGFEALGAVAVSEMAGYLPRLEERERQAPCGDALLFLRGLASPERQFPCARTVVAGVLDISRYRIPDGVRNLIGRHYLCDCRRNPLSPEGRMVSELTRFMERMGLMHASNEQPGVVPVRWAAWKAGLGIMRRNNFFYTATGSLKTIVAWAVDRELEMPRSPAPPPCPEGCGKCAEACPSGSLSGPYSMNLKTCVSYLTNLAGDVRDRDTCRKMGGWLYGCDDCQLACPFNGGRWNGTDDFPGLEETALKATPESILAMGIGEIKTELAGKFFYIRDDSLYRWKLNALNVIANTGRSDLAGSVRGALSDPNAEVRRKASDVLRELGEDAS
jgi:epoxyqueuosine reductase